MGRGQSSDIRVSRFGVSLEQDLLKKLDNLVKKHKFPNRSQAIRYLIRNTLIDEAYKEDIIVAGVIVLIYDHHRRNVVNRLLRIQHDFSVIIVSSQHVHLDHDNCLETIVLKGKASNLKDLSDRLIATKGVKHGKLVMSGT